jgi:hypothetical protein
VLWRSTFCACPVEEIFSKCITKYKINYEIKFTALLITAVIEGLDDTNKYHWVIVDMKAAWKRIYSLDK